MSESRLKDSAKSLREPKRKFKKQHAATGELFNRRRVFKFLKTLSNCTNLNQKAPST
jgi:hypothetical protein